MAISIGIPATNIEVYKSSEIWKRLIKYKDQDIFQQFYTVLSQMKSQDYLPVVKISNLFQISIDIFFCNYFNKLYPEDVSSEMHLNLFGENKEKIYYEVREIMKRDGLINSKKPILIKSSYAYFIQDFNIPEWNMKEETITDIINSMDIPKKFIWDTYERIFEYLEKLTIEPGSNYSFSELKSELKNKDNDEIKQPLSKNLFAYLQAHKEKYFTISNEVNEVMLKISGEKEIQEITRILKSKIGLKILSLADGTRNSSTIARELGKSPATIGMYLKEIRDLNLIRTLANGKLKRNIKGLKINLEFGC